jgi:uncharacterized protein with HEPN domain
MPPRQAAYLLDIFRSVQAIQEYLAGYSHQQFLQDAKTQDAVLRRLLVVGEAAARLTPETCAEFPNIPFPRIIGMRNRIVHDYGHVDLEIIWEIVYIHLPQLFAEFQQFFANRNEA